MVTSQEQEGGRGRIEIGEEEVQAIMYKISYNDIFQKVGNIAYIL